MDKKNTLYSNIREELKRGCFFKDGNSGVYKALLYSLFIIIFTIFMWDIVYFMNSMSPQFTFKEKRFYRDIYSLSFTPVPYNDIYSNSFVVLIVSLIFIYIVFYLFVNKKGFNSNVIYISLFLQYVLYTYGIILVVILFFFVSESHQYNIHKQKNDLDIYIQENAIHNGVKSNFNGIKKEDLKTKFIEFLNTNLKQFTENNANDIKKAVLTYLIYDTLHNNGYDSIEDNMSYVDSINIDNSTLFTTDSTLFTTELITLYDRSSVNSIKQYCDVVKLDLDTRIMKLKNLSDNSIPKVWFLIIFILVIYFIFIYVLVNKNISIN